jgi:hypothetical protein
MHQLEGAEGIVVGLLAGGARGGTLQDRACFHRPIGRGSALDAATV